MKKKPAPASSELEEEERTAQKLPRKIYLGIMFVMVIIATVVISANGEQEGCASMHSYIYISS